MWAKESLATLLLMDSLIVLQTPNGSCRRAECFLELVQLHEAEEPRVLQCEGWRECVFLLHDLEFFCLLTKRVLLLPRLDCSRMIMAHCRLNLPGSSKSPVSALTLMGPLENMKKGNSLTYLV
uniref:mitogen-activated protein kinase kinase kinase kinase 1-like n=1 Tax=Callithrix jacchus TaxID=9483 RepID=UPI0023DD5121|nr:mitogen-activated protein kinase kinase kinase kinase 1-like [Callithrix jacchus]